MHLERFSGRSFIRGSCSSV